MRGPAWPPWMGAFCFHSDSIDYSEAMNTPRIRFLVGPFLMGALLLSFLGLLTSLWADKFDHAAAVTNFVVTPLSLLSGTFYSVEQLAPSFRAISHANPFFYVISGFRYGFLGISDSPIVIGATALLAVNVALWALCYSLLKRGWKIKQ